jgi:hypothetical protein
MVEAASSTSMRSGYVDARMCRVLSEGGGSKLVLVNEISEIDEYTCGIFF